MFKQGKLYPLLVAAGVCLAALPFASCRKGADKPVLVVYCSADQEYAEPILAEFQKQTGITLQVRYDSEANKTVGLVQRLRAEKDQPTADVFWSNEIFHTIRLAEEGLLQPCQSQKLPACNAYCDPPHRWHGFALRARAIAYNTQRVSDEQGPQCLEDLLDAKWKGRLVMAWPQFGTTGGDVASWFVHYGPARARQILQGLADNGVRMVDSNSTAVRLIATGQADVALTDTDDVYAGRRNGWSVSMHFLDQGGAGVLVVPNTAAVIRNAPHANLAERLVEFLISPQVEETLARSDAHNTPVDPALKKQFAEYDIPQPLNVDYVKVSQAMGEAISAANEVLKR